MQYRKLAAPDLAVSAVAMGCWPIVGDQTWGPQIESDAIAAIEASLEAGVTLFDTAEAYGSGSSERLIGRVLRSHRNRVLIASKVSPRNMAPNDLIAACEQSLRNLQIDAIDLYQLHWPAREIPFEKTVSALERLLRDGKIRAVGLSNFGPADLAAFLPIMHPAADQVAYNLLFRAAEFDLLDACAKNDVVVLCHSPLAEGLLTGKFAAPDDVPAGRARTRHFGRTRPFSRHSEDGAEAETFDAVARIRAVASGLGLPMGSLALAWLLRRKPVASVLAGARNAAQARANAAAADLDLPDDVIAELDDITQPLKERLGPNLDPWQSQSRIR